MQEGVDPAGMAGDPGTALAAAAGDMGVVAAEGEAAEAAALAAALEAAAAAAMAEAVAAALAAAAAGVDSGVVAAMAAAEPQSTQPSPRAWAPPRPSMASTGVWQYLKRSSLMLMLR